MRKEYLVIDCSYEGMLEFNYEEAKRSGVDGVILHAGYGSDISQKDACFDEAYDRAVSAGLLVGAYWFDYFRSVEDARTEAEVFHEAIGDRYFPLGLYFDYEEATIDYMDRCGSSKEDMTDRIVAAIEHMIELGHEKVRFYCNPNCYYGAHGATALESYKLTPYGWWLAKFDSTPEDIGQIDGINIVGKQWGNNDMKPDNISWIPNIDISTFYLDDIDDSDINVGNISDDSDALSREQATKLVNGLYARLLMREYGNDENEGLIQGLISGEYSRADAFNSIVVSDEYKKKALIMQCYLFMRGMLPSPGELHDWYAYSEDEIKQGILYSPEFNMTYEV